jgi:hypothetical protein
MKVTERSEFRDEDGVINLQDRIRATLEYGLSWYSEMQAQLFTTEKLIKHLGREHSLLRNVTIPGTDLVVPMILLSPQGVRVIIPSPSKGLFRAKGEEWLKQEGRSRTFKPTRPNLQITSHQFAQVVHRYIKDQGYALPEVEAVLVFTDPRTHVDQATPYVRIVQADAIEHFAVNMQRLQPIMDLDDIKELSDALLNPRIREPELAAEPALAGDEVQMRPPPAMADMGRRFAPDPESLAGRIPLIARLQSMGFSRQQWILLIVMGFFQLVIMMIIFALIVADTLFA